ncbi:type II toxin-antitoxin system RelE/ParE family toxin [bacterium]|nr:type II toxin-antitoxin system RelE/ParE family toxin [bacterium]
MASYNVSLKRSAEKELRRLDKSQIPKILSAVQTLAKDPFPKGSRKLVGSTKTFRIRIGDYRILYTVDPSAQLVEIQRIRHRKEVYD